MVAECPSKTQLCYHLPAPKPLRASRFLKCEVQIPCPTLKAPLSDLAPLDISSMISIAHFNLPHILVKLKYHLSIHPFIGSFL